MKPLPAFYSEKIKYYETQTGIIKRKVNFFSVFRLIGFTAFAASVYLYIQQRESFFIISSIAFFALFIWLVRISLNLKEQQSLFEKLLFINKNELNVVENKSNQFNNGQSFLTHESYLDDLDIFGESSLYHLLNRTTTSHGSTQLAGLLSKPFLAKNDIEEFQDAVRILSIQTDQRQLLNAHGLLHDENKGNLHSITEWLKIHSQLNHKWWLKILRIVLPVYNIAAALYYLSEDHLVPLLIGIGASSLLVGIYIKYINGQHLLISQKQEILNQYAAILKIFGTVDKGPSQKLQEMQATTAKAFHAMNRLSQLSSFFDQRMNLVVAVFFNMLFVYDLQCLLALEKWKEKYKNDFDEWINCVGNIECVNSLATFAFNNPGYTYPLVSGHGLQVSAKQMAHPLIPAKESIPNDFEIGNSSTLQLVTGSNMSGKTTFLRTIGVNLILAQCGAPVCAGSFSFTPMNILSSIRVSDSLQEHTSYFMAELKKLQQIINHLKNGEPALVMIDEILRGTNSDDKTHGSEQFIRKLLQYKCMALFATHDLSLGILENEFPGIISNYCFESVIENNELYFDYKLQRGIAKNKNASFLMKKMDII
jgi:DNA mismatch repair ATPase MutS